ESSVAWALPAVGRGRTRRPRPLGGAARAVQHRSVTRDGGAGRRGRRLRFDSAPRGGAPRSAAARGGRSKHPIHRRRIEAERVPPPPRTAVSGHAPSASLPSSAAIELRPTALLAPP